jgi:hypothetical protein
VLELYLRSGSVDDLAFAAAPTILDAERFLELKADALLPKWGA